MIRTASREEGLWLLVLIGIVMALMFLAVIVFLPNRQPRPEWEPRHRYSSVFGHH
jgi:hypothetical protein